MFKNVLNQIEKNEDEWYCVVFDFNQINVGGLYVSFDQFSQIDLSSFDNYKFRVYRKSKKLIVSGTQVPREIFCALSFKYQMWRCMLCKKICKVNENECFCETYSKCWTPLNFQVDGLIFSDKLDFQYHFNPDSFSNLPL